jgi:hypothetical protein
MANIELNTPKLFKLVQMNGGRKIYWPGYYTSMAHSRTQITIAIGRGKGKWSYSDFAIEEYDVTANGNTLSYFDGMKDSQIKNIVKDMDPRDIIILKQKGIL